MSRNVEVAIEFSWKHLVCLPFAAGGQTLQCTQSPSFWVDLQGVLSAGLSEHRLTEAFYDIERFISAVGCPSQSDLPT